MARSDLQEYEVEVNGIKHTFQFDAETAKRTPGARKVGRSVPLATPPGETDAEDAQRRTGTKRAAAPANKADSADADKTQTSPK